MYFVHARGVRVAILVHGALALTSRQFLSLLHSHFVLFFLVSERSALYDVVLALVHWYPTDKHVNKDTKKRRCTGLLLLAGQGAHDS